MKRWGLLGLLVLALAVALVQPVKVALAQGGEVATATAEPSLDYAPYLGTGATPVAEPSLTETLLSILWKLGLVVLLVYGTLWVMKRFSVRRVTSGGQQMQLMETVSLGANRSLHLVRVGNQTLLVSATPQEVRNLADVTDSVSIDEPWTEADLQPGITMEGEGEAGRHEGRTLMPSFEAIERVRRLWRRSDQ